MKVYLVWYGTFEPDVEAVFATRASAQAYIDAERAKPSEDYRRSDLDWWMIDEREVAP